MTDGKVDEFDEWNSLADPYVCSWSIPYFLPAQDEVPEYHLINATIELMVLILLGIWILIVRQYNTNHDKKLRKKWSFLILLPAYVRVLLLYFAVTFLRFATLVTNAAYLKFGSVQSANVILEIMEIAGDMSLIWIQTFILFLLAQTSGIVYLIYIYIYVYIHMCSCLF